VGFHLKPFGFFDVNPSIDVPPEKDAHSVRHGAPPAPAAGCATCGSAAGGAACCQAPTSKL
jgi:primary-amine oxidase